VAFWSNKKKQANMIEKVTTVLYKQFASIFGGGNGSGGGVKSNDLISRTDSVTSIQSTTTTAKRAASAHTS
jgi:hypothetical protein